MFDWQCPRCGSTYSGTALMTRCFACNEPVMPSPPKTFNDGLEAAALYHDKIAGEFRVLAGQDIMNAPTYLDSAVNHGCDAASIRALKESK